MPTTAPIYQPHLVIGSTQSYEPGGRANAYRRGLGGKRWVGAKRERGLGGLRGRIYRRDHGRCQECGRVCVPKDAGGQAHEWPSIDHIIPTSKGGTDDVDNLRLLCVSCNAAKRDREEGRGGKITLSALAKDRVGKHAQIFTGFGRGV